MVTSSFRVSLTLAVILALTGVVLWFMLTLPRRDDVWQRLQAGSPLRVAVDPSFPPFDAIDAHGEFVGFDIDLAREIGHRLGAPVEFIAISFDGLVDAVLAGKADVVISAFPLDQRLTEDVRYSQPYFEAGLVWVTRIDSDILEPQQLATTTVIVEWGSQGDAWARAQGFSHLARAETPDAALIAVLNGDADVAIVDAVTVALFPGPGLRVHSPPLTSDPYVIVISPTAPRLAAAVDEALTDVIADGAWGRLAGKYFPNPPQPPSHSMRP